MFKKKTKKQKINNEKNIVVKNDIDYSFYEYIVLFLRFSKIETVNVETSVTEIIFFFQKKKEIK